MSKAWFLPNRMLINFFKNFVIRNLGLPEPAFLISRDVFSRNRKVFLGITIPDYI